MFSVLPRDNQRDREQKNGTEINKQSWEVKYLSGNNLPRINLIRGKLFPDRYLHPIPAC